MCAPTQTHRVATPCASRRTNAAACLPGHLASPPTLRRTRMCVGGSAPVAAGPGRAVEEGRVGARVEAGRGGRVCCSPLRRTVELLAGVPCLADPSMAGGTRTPFTPPSPPLTGGAAGRGAATDAGAGGWRDQDTEDARGEMSRARSGRLELRLRSGVGLGRARVGPGLGDACRLQTAAARGARRCRPLPRSHAAPAPRCPRAAPAPRRDLL